METKNILVVKETKLRKKNNLANLTMQNDLRNFCIGIT